ncbi:MAG: hypothetical protein KA141_00205 [Rubrivivax sp.]|nr:hypothetical protein [Rubrivivax sp.]
MIHSHHEMQAVERALDLERPLQVVEDRLNALTLALHHQDAEALDRVAAELHGALAAAVGEFSLAARTGGVPPMLRQRLAVAGGQVAAQREALARATASLDRAIDVLIPRLANAGLYSAAGNADRGAAPGGGLLA